MLKWACHNLFDCPSAYPPSRLQAATGLLVNLVSVGILNFAINTYGTAIFGLSDLPLWASSPMLANSTNASSLVNCR